MNQPPHARPPAWRRPRGVTAGIWEYVHQRSIADHYEAFVADTPLCRLDEQVVQTHLAKADPQQNSIVLDLGCGNGRIATRLLERGHTVVGVDLSQRMLELMVDKSRAQGTLDRLVAVRANLVELDAIASASVDHAVCMFSTLGMIHGRDNRRSVLRHAARAVRPGGQLVLHVHHRWAAVWEPGGWRALARSRVRSLVRKDEDFGDSTYAYRGLSEMYLHRFSRRELHADLVATGWRPGATLAIALDGSRILQSAVDQRFRAGGFFVIASRV